MSTDNTFFANGGPLGGVNLTNVGDTAEFPVGTLVEGTNASIWEYVRATDGAVTQYQAVCINGSGTAIPATTTHAGTLKKVGFAQVAIGSGQYGWVARMGYGLTVKAAASAAAGALIYTTATAGTVDSTAVTAACIMGTTLIVASSGGGVSNVTMTAATPAFIARQTAGA